VQGTRRPALRVAAVERVGRLQRVRIDDDDRVERGTVLVLGVDPFQVLLDERATGQRAVAKRGVNLRDCRFFEAKCRCLCSRRRDDQRGDKGRSAKVSRCGQRGMFPCFFGGFLSRLFSRFRSAAMSLRRVSRG